MTDDAYVALEVLSCERQAEAQITATWRVEALDEEGSRAYVVLEAVTATHAPAKGWFLADVAEAGEIQLQVGQNASASVRTVDGHFQFRSVAGPRQSSYHAEPYTWQELVVTGEAIQVSAWNERVTCGPATWGGDFMPAGVEISNLDGVACWGNGTTQFNPA